MTVDNKLEPIEPREAIELFQADRETEVSKATHRHQGYRLERFAEWCDEVELTDLNNLGGRDVQRFKTWRRRSGVNNVTLKSNTDTIRVFLRFAESIDAVTDGIADSVQSPTLEYGENRSEDIVTAEKAKKILSYQRKSHYAELSHALFRSLWEIGCRMGAARAIDLDDLYIRDEHVKLRH